ncbi:MAG TPA: hypothetical protein VEE82_03800 [Thermodesulfovibrionales bacterium]|nr:hypothetical protein [Thermodesulfovibrionales bacterium]
MTKPAEKIGIFSDMVSKTLHCRNNPRYKDYRSIDSKGTVRLEFILIAGSWIVEVHLSPRSLGRIVECR